MNFTGRLLLEELLANVPGHLAEGPISPHALCQLEISGLSGQLIPVPAGTDCRGKLPSVPYSIVIIRNKPARMTTCRTLLVSHPS